jgi:hypothetical protein
MPPKRELPAHVPGSRKGEEEIKRSGKEPGRERLGRTARDSTSINPDKAGPIDPRMPDIPPA